MADVDLTLTAQDIGIPLIGPGTALFLDFDGTLVDIAATPQSITVPDDLGSLINRLADHLDGSVCLVSGRTLADLNQFLPDVAADIVAEHGAVERIDMIEQVHAARWPESWRAALGEFAGSRPAIVVEYKHGSVALHCRKDPALLPAITRFANDLLHHPPSGYEAVSSNLTVELRRPGIDKGKAIARILQHPRYRGKYPMFAADDVTDLPGFKAVRDGGGRPLHVGSLFGGKPANVRRWLAASLHICSRDTQQPDRSQSGNRSLPNLVEDRCAAASS